VRVPRLNNHDAIEKVRGGVEANLHGDFPIEQKAVYQQHGLGTVNAL
jgi:hypothetical protein